MLKLIIESAFTNELIELNLNVLSLVVVVVS